MLKKASLIIRIFLSLSFVFIFSAIPVHAEIVCDGSNLSAELKQAIDKYNGGQYCIAIGSKTYPANQSMWDDTYYNYVVYGTPNDVTSSITSALGLPSQSTSYQNDTGRNEKRYLGFTADGTPFFNNFYPDDTNVYHAPWNRQWDWQPWRSKAEGGLDTYPKINEELQYHAEMPQWFSELIKVSQAAWYFYTPTLEERPRGYPWDTNAEDMANYFAILSPLTEITPFVSVGRNTNGTYYDTMTVAPKPINQPDLSIKIEQLTSQATASMPGVPNFPGSLDTSKDGPFRFKAKITVTVDEDFNWPSPWPNPDNTDKYDQGIPVWFWFAQNGQVPSWSWHEEIFPATKTHKGDFHEYELEWEGDFGDSIYLRARVNPQALEPLGKDVIFPEKDYSDNIAEIPINLNNKPIPPSESKKYKKFTPEYTYVDQKLIQVNMDDSFNMRYNPKDYSKHYDWHRLFTYRPNRIVMETSKYTERVEITFNEKRNNGDPGTTYKVALNHKYNKLTSKYDDSIEKYVRFGTTFKNINDLSTDEKEKYDKYIYSPGNPDNNTPSLSVKDEQRTPSSTTSTSIFEKEWKRAWTFDFSMKNYSIFPEPIANSSYVDKLIFETFDHNGVSETKPRYEEINPLYYIVNVRQTKLFNLRINDVKDIYWKYVFNDTSEKFKEYESLQEDKKNDPPFGITKMPLTSVPLSNNRLISKGYSMQFKVDSEGLSGSDDNSITVKPTFWWYDKQNNTFKAVDLYFDVPNKDLYNVPIELDPLATGSNYKEKVIKHFEDNRTPDTTLVKLKEKYENILKDASIKKYSKFTFGPTSTWFQNKKEDKYLLSGEDEWQFSSNSKDTDPPGSALDINEDNYYTAFKSYRNTWTFTYSLHPEVKAYIKGANPFTAKPMTGALLVNFKIVTSNSVDPGTTRYHYTKYEEGWYKNPVFDSIIVDEALPDEVKGKGNVFYYNLDWSAINDISPQQKW